MKIKLICADIYRVGNAYESFNICKDVFEVKHNNAGDLKKFAEILERIEHSILQHNPSCEESNHSVCSCRTVNLLADYNITFEIELTTEEVSNLAFILEYMISELDKINNTLLDKHKKSRQRQLLDEFFDQLAEFSDRLKKEYCIKKVNKILEKNELKQKDLKDIINNIIPNTSKECFQDLAVQFQKKDIYFADQNMNKNVVYRSINENETIYILLPNNPTKDIIKIKKEQNELYVLYIDGEGNTRQKLKLGERPMQIGRRGKRNNDENIDYLYCDEHTNISRRHVKISYEEGQVRIEILSTNPNLIYSDSNKYLQPEQQQLQKEQSQNNIEEKKDVKIQQNIQNQPNQNQVNLNQNQPTGLSTLTYPGLFSGITHNNKYIKIDEKNLDQVITKIENNEKLLKQIESDFGISYNDAHNDSQELKQLILEKIKENEKNALSPIGLFAGIPHNNKYIKIDEDNLNQVITKIKNNEGLLKQIESDFGISYNHAHNNPQELKQLILKKVKENEENALSPI